MQGFDLSTISRVYLNNRDYSEIYLGQTLIWPIHDYSQDYLTFNVKEETVFRFYKNPDATGNDIQYSLDNGTTWVTLPSSNQIELYPMNNCVVVPENSKIIWKAQITPAVEDINYGLGIGRFIVPLFGVGGGADQTGEFTVSGNIMSLLYGDNFVGKNTLDWLEFGNLFGSLKPLRDAKNLILPTTVGTKSYKAMFQHCRNLTTPPELPAEILARECYASMFAGCISLNYIKCLATDISATDCLYGWVYDVAPTGTFVKYDTTTYTIGDDGIPTGWIVEDIPAPHDYSQDYLTIVSLRDNNIIGWKANNTNLTKTISVSTDNGVTWTSYTSNTTTSGAILATLNTGDKLLVKGNNTQYATSTTNYNYFVSSTKFDVEGNIMSLIAEDNFTNQFVLSSTYSFTYLFRGSQVCSCENLILPATTLTAWCYSYMFYNCLNLITAPEIPATTLANSCYYNMFWGCTSLTTAPALPATTLESSCYYNMFRGCTSLTTAPELPATTLVSNCYQYMFSGCTSLTTAPALPATTLVTNCYNNMFNGCSSLNYIKCLAIDIYATDCLNGWVTGVAATGTFEKHAENSWWPIGSSGIPTNWTVINDPSTIYDYSQDYLTFTAMSDNTSFSFSRNNLQYSLDNGTTWSTLSAGYSTPAINTGDKIIWKRTGLTPSSGNGIGTFGSSGLFKVSGNIMSLLYGDNFISNNSLTGYNNAFQKLFYGNNKIKYAQSLILPAMTLVDDCYDSMFMNCTSLTTPPQLPATSIAMECYSNMFRGCTALKSAPALPALTMYTNSYCAMFDGCTRLENAPELPAVTLGIGSYAYMFRNCPLINYIKCLAIDKTANLCLYLWTSGVASSGTFVKDSSATWPSGGSGIPNNWTIQNA